MRCFIIALSFIVGASSISSQTINNGIMMTEVEISQYKGEEIVKILTLGEENLILLKSPAGRARMLYNKTGQNFKEIDVSDVVGGFYSEVNTAPGKSMIIPTWFITNHDGFYFHTLPINTSCGGSYRVKNGNLETITVPGMKMDLKTYEGAALRASILCGTIANPLKDSEDEILLFINAREENRSVNWSGFAKKKGNLFTILLPVFFTEQPASYPHPYALTQNDSMWGVWGDNKVIKFLETDRQSFIRASQFDLSKKTITRLYEFTSPIDGNRVESLNYITDAGERFPVLNIGDRTQVYNFPEFIGIPNLLYEAPSNLGELGSFFPVIRGALSKKMMLIGFMGLVPDTSRYYRYNYIGVWDGAETRILIQEGTKVGSKVVKNLNHTYPEKLEMWTSSECRGLVPSYVEGGRQLDFLIQLKMPCINNHPENVKEGSVVRITGKDFTLGSNNVEVEIGANRAQAFDVTSTGLSFVIPASCINICSVRVVSGQLRSNAVKLLVAPLPVSKPAIESITDINGNPGASPGKAMSVWGMNFCSVTLPIPIFQEGVVPLRTEYNVGCRVIVDSKLVGIYAAYTHTSGKSQINILLPYDLPNGNHQVVIDKFEMRNGVPVTTSRSEPFTMLSVEASPTFFRPYNYPLTIQNASKGNSLVGENNPVDAGDHLVIYLSGGGITVDLPPDRGALRSLYKYEVKLKINGEDVRVLYGGSQGEFPGLEQINFQVPNSIKTAVGYVTLEITIGGVTQKFSFHTQ